MNNIQEPPVLAVPGAAVSQVEPLNPNDCVQILREKVDSHMREPTFDNALDVCRASRDCWLALLGQAVYGPTRATQKVYSDALYQLDRAVNSLDRVKSMKATRDSSRQRKQMASYLSAVKERHFLVKLLQVDGVDAVNAHLAEKK